MHGGIALSDKITSVRALIGLVWGCFFERALRRVSLDVRRVCLQPILHLMTTAGLGIPAGRVLFRRVCEPE